MNYHDINNRTAYFKLKPLYSYWLYRGLSDKDDLKKITADYQKKWDNIIKDIIPFNLEGFKVSSHFYNENQDCIELQGKPPYKDDTIRIYKGKYIIEFK